MTVDPRNKLNDLTAKEWLTRTVSVFTQRGLGGASKEAKFEKLHPAPYSFTDVTRFVEFFTKKGGEVIDPFGGVGSTAKAACLIGRNVTSIELNPYFADITKQRLEAELPSDTEGAYEIICEDVREALKKLPKNKFDLILTSPPYWNILNKVDHKAKQERQEKGVMHNYGDSEADLGQIDDYKEFLKELTNIFSKLSKSMKPKAHAVIVVGDFRHKSTYHMFHSDLAQKMEASNKWVLKGITIMYQRHKRVFPYGYPYAYVPNLHHQYAMIFQKAS